MTTIDTNPAAGYLLGGPYAEAVDLRSGASLDILPTLGRVDFFLHDSLRTREHELAEIAAVSPRLGPGAFVVSNTGDVSAGLAEWAEQTGRAFAYFQERPADHWYPGGGIAVAHPRR